jgi:hypothetical protein
MRKVIQIAAQAPSSGTDSDAGNDAVLFALCDDGTIWFYEFMGKNSKWERFHEVPQE